MPSNAMGKFFWIFFLVKNAHKLPQKIGVTTYIAKMKLRFANVIACLSGGEGSFILN